MQCPGQDTRFWKPDDVFEIPCQACGNPVEFFKNDARRRCPRCGKRIQNPKISLGCARWCAYAKECLGFDPKTLQLSDSAEVSLTDKLVEAVKAEFGKAQDHITHSLLVLDLAQDLMRREGGDPRVVLAASLLHDVGIPAAEHKYGTADGAQQEAEGPPVARRILEGLGFEEEAIAQVCRIVGSHHRGDLDTPEFRVVWDADHLMEVPAGFRSLNRNRLRAIIDRVFRTASGRQRAYQAFAKFSGGEEESHVEPQAGS
ncbi:MAG: HD domain-containing protein [Candidatus Latescibacteria bacterium]|nr:HD domain-containing protein [Candidatus Latescibacterota bacterium]